ncbi:MAG TPA: hypothetical protein VGF59_14540 [Bryobacteraceae bacterium]|jgi:RNA polymerase sigma-70 factor (ECF subfamily)
MCRGNVLGAARFPSTQWSLVGRAGRVSDEHRRESLGVLLRRYLPALRAHMLLAKRIPADRVDDLLQGFVADKIIEQNLLAAADQRRGRFRSFLLAALDHFMVSQLRHETAAKRSPAGPLLDISDQRQITAGGNEPSLQFILIWARQVVEEARRRMERRCSQSGRTELWLVFTQRILAPAAQPRSKASHEEVAESLHLTSAKAASNLLVTGKRLFARMLREVVGEYAANEGEIDREIEELMRILSQHE